jgi:hypothetical protein
VSRGSAEFGGRAAEVLMVSNVNAQGRELGFCCLSCTARSDNRQPEIGDTVLSIALGILARHWDWNTEKQARGGGDAIVLSTETLNNLYRRARRCEKTELTPQVRQTERTALQEAAKAVWDGLPGELKQKGLTRRPTLAGVVRFATDRNHFAAVKLDLQDGTVEVSDAAKAWIGEKAACSTCPTGHCEGPDKAGAVKLMWQALYAAVPTPGHEPQQSEEPPQPSCSWDLHRRQREMLDTNCGIFALTDLRELLRGSPLRCDATTAANGRHGRS